MTQFNTLITGGRIIDGTGNPWFYGDVAIANDSVAAIAPPGTMDPQQAQTTVDASGMVVCPGFIDILSHSIIPLMADPQCLSKITQGVTTEIMGEGWCPSPYSDKMDLSFLRSRAATAGIEDWVQRIPGWGRFRDWLEALAERGVASNIGSFMGGGSLRMYAKGMEMGQPSDDELATMQRVMAEAMEDGAMGVSQALIYPPSAYTDTDELVAISKVIARYNGVYITHLRSEADELMEALEEAIDVGQRANVPVQIYHLKAAGKRNWHKMEAVLERIAQARAQGVDITADMYPYPAMGTGLSAILPPWTAAGGKFFDNLRDAETRARVKAETLNPTGGWEAIADLVGPENVMPVGLHQPENQSYVGKRLTEIATMRNQDWFDAAADLFLSEEQRIATIYYSMNEDNLREQLRQPWIMIGTDAGGMDPAWARGMGPVHPRGYGSYPRILGRYVREEGVIPLEDAIRKMSGAVAARLGIRDRGLLREGCKADVVIFDPNTVADRATFADPHQLSVGIRDVWVNGTPVLTNGVHTQATPGEIVDGPGR